MSRKDLLEDLKEKIQKFGWGVVNVDESGKEPRYSYTVGLESAFRHPEVIVFGLEAEKAQRLLNVIGGEVRNGRHFDAMTMADDLLEGFTCAFRLAAPAAVRAYMGLATRVSGREITVLHCIWPDKHGHFPWEAGASEGYRRLQPMLADGPEAATFQKP